MMLMVATILIALEYYHVISCLWVKNRVTPESNPRKRKHGLKPAVPWWFNFHPRPHVASVLGVWQLLFRLLNLDLPASSGSGAASQDLPIIDSMQTWLTLEGEQNSFFGS